MEGKQEFKDNLMWERRSDSLFLAISEFHELAGITGYYVQCSKGTSMELNPCFKRVFFFLKKMEYAVRQLYSQPPHPIRYLSGGTGRAWICLHVRPPNQATECWTGRPRIKQKTVQIH